MNSLHRRCSTVLLLVFLAFLAGCGGQREGPSTADKTPPVTDSAALSRFAATDTMDGAADLSGGLVLIRVGGVPVRVRISQTPREKERGLMFTEQLPADEGMLFVFEYEHQPAFWMKNTPIDLDLAFIDGRGRIVEIRPMKALDEETIHRSRHPALYALEMNAGWFRKHGVTVGDEVEF